MADTTQRSREDMELELHRLNQMYRLLPPEKQKTHRVSMQRRINELNAALNGKSASKPKKPMGTTSGILLGLIGAIVALAGGFFIIMLIAKSRGS